LEHPWPEGKMTLYIKEWFILEHNILNIEK
jgi:hypothetical protein